jgi:hypothetical protein
VANASVGKRHIHHGTGVTFGARQVDQTTFAKHIDAATAGQDVLVDEGAGLALFDGNGFDGVKVDFDVEVTAVGNDTTILHGGEVFGVKHMLVAGAVTTKSAWATASTMGITRKPSMAASSALTASTSVTMTQAPSTASPLGDYHVEQ